MVAVVHMLCAELGYHSIAAVDIDQGEGWGSRIQEPAVGTLLVVVEDNVVPGSLDVVRHYVEGKEKVYTLVVVALMRTAVAVHMLHVAGGVLESTGVEDQLLGHDRDKSRRVRNI